MILHLLYQIKVWLLLFIMRDAQNLLKKKKRFQEKRFDRLKLKFAKKYYTIKNLDESRLIIPLWRRYNRKLEKFFLPSPPFYFLRIPAVLKTMFVTTGGRWQQEETAFLEGKFKKRELRELLEEDLVGGPILLDSRYLSSHNSIHHLYHLARFINATTCDLGKVNTVVEWGGGYGNMAKIFTRLRVKPTTYVLIDTVLFCCIQWLYLATIFSENKVNLIQNLRGEIQKGKVNILPVGYVEKYKIQADLFISTWALSESSRASQDLVVRRKWFGAKKILLGYQVSSKNIPYADNLSKEVAKIGAKIEPIDFLSGNFYAFR